MLHALKTIASSRSVYNEYVHSDDDLKALLSFRDDIVPELTKTFFENILRASDESPKLVVTNVRVDDSKEFGRHFCSEVHAVEVTAKVKVKEGSNETEEVIYHLIVKSQPQSEDARRFLQPSQTFEKEVQMYGQVSEARFEAKVKVNFLLYRFFMTWPTLSGNRVRSASTAKTVR